MSAAPEPGPEPTAVSRGLADPGFHTLIQDVPHVAVFAYECGGSLSFWNRGAERIFGHGATSALDLDPTSLLGIDLATANSGVHELRHRDGHSVRVLLLLESEERRGRPAAVHAVAIPLNGIGSDSVRLDGQLIRAQKLESLGVLAGGIAHDFNNLLLGVVGNADLVLMELDADHPARDAVEQIAQAGLRAADLCRQLLAFSGKGKMIEEPLDLSRLVQELAPLIHMSLGGSRLQLELAADLPVVEADATQIRQIVMNLVTNAAEALLDKPGRIAIRTLRHDASNMPLTDAVTGRALPAGEYVCLAVEDDGVGMAREQRERIFEPFFTTKFMGRGLGLAAAQGIVRAHHGTITVHSEPDGGSTFAVYLPVVGLRSAHAPQPLADTDARSAPSADRSAKHVLVVDDEKHVREVAGHLLSAAGYEVSRAEDGMDALAILARDPTAVDLVLLDMTMPGLDGLEVLERIRRVRPDLPVLLSSGYSRDKVGDVLSTDLACGFIQKPYRRGELIGVTASMLDGPDDDV